MKTVSRKEGDRIFDQFLAEAKQEWFKVEVLQDYTAEDDSPSLRAWLAGNRKEALALLKKEAQNSEWSKELGRLVIKKTRLRVVKNLSRRISNGNCKAIDDDRVIKNNYVAGGRCVGMGVYERGEDISYFLNLKNELSRYKVPLV